MFIDTHTHLNDEELFKDRADIIDRALKTGVKIIVNAADSFKSFENILKLTEEFPGICYPVLGIHPSNYKEYDLKKLQSYIMDNINTVLAVGEIGLDYHYEMSEEDKEGQKFVFINQILFAKKYNLPIVVHSRDADKDTFDILKEHAKGLSIDIHCFPGTPEMAKQYIKEFPNIKFGIGGVLTFKNARKLVDVCLSVGREHLLLETDAPYLAPVPFRGKLNEPKNVRIVAETLAILLHTSVKEVENFTTKNAKEFYRL